MQRGRARDNEAFARIQRLASPAYDTNTTPKRLHQLHLASWLPELYAVRAWPIWRVRSTCTSWSEMTHPRLPTRVVGYQALSHGYITDVCSGWSRQERSAAP